MKTLFCCFFKRKEKTETPSPRKDTKDKHHTHVNQFPIFNPAIDDKRKTIYIDMPRSMPS